MIRRYTPFVVSFCLIGCGCCAVTLSKEPSFSISIDLSKPIAIHWPCETAIVGDEGEKGLRIAPEVDCGCRGEAGGHASYSFFIPQNGMYFIWANCLWHNDYSNAIFIQFDQAEKALIGNDPIYNEWHWIQCFAVKTHKRHAHFNLIKPQ